MQVRKVTQIIAISHYAQLVSQATMSTIVAYTLQLEVEETQDHQWSCTFRSTEQHSLFPQKWY